jgi:hypothetical protein
MERRTMGPAIRGKGRFTGRAALEEGLAYPAREDHGHPLRSSWGMDTGVSAMARGDVESERALREILGVPVTVRDLPLSKKANLRELEQEAEDE